jgi:hypothetical protein
LGYSVDHPGLGEPKEAKGKYKASGYGDLNESIQPINEEESKLRKVIREMIDAELSILPKTSLKESVEKELAAINKEAEHEIIASKLEKVQTLIDKKQAQISRLDEDEDLKDLTDAKKVKEISKDIKSLEKAKAKLEKMMHKGKAKSPRKEVIDETDETIDEAENEEYIEDAEKRQDDGQKIPSILANYNNISAEKRREIGQGLETRKQDFEIDKETAEKIKELAEKSYEEYGTLEDALSEFENKDEKELARQHLTDAYGL